MRSACFTVLLLVLLPDGLRAATSASATTSRPTAVNGSKANKPTVLPPRRVSKSLSQTLVANRSDQVAPWYRTLPVALGIVLVIILGCAVFARRYLQVGGGSSPTGGLEVIARTHLSPKQSICLVRAAGRLVMVGVTPERITHLTDIENADAAAQLIGQAETHKPHSSTAAFNRLVDDEVTAYRVDEDATAIEVRETDSGSYLETRGQLHGVLSKVRQYARSKRTA